MSYKSEDGVLQDNEAMNTLGKRYGWPVRRKIKPYGGEGHSWAYLGR